MQHKVEDNQRKFLESLLSEPGTDSMEVLGQITVHFPDGCEADIKVCDGDSRWIDAVLFDENGHQMTVLEPSNGPIIGKYSFDEVHVVELV